MIAFHEAACIALGLDIYPGHPVLQGPVVYVCGEGRNGIGRRLAAWEIQHGRSLDDAPFVISQRAIPMLVKDELEVATAYIDKAEKEKKQHAFEDIIWALINTKEFLFSH